MKIFEAPKKGDVFFKPDSGGEKTYASINRIKGVNNDAATFYISDGYRESCVILLKSIMDIKHRDWAAIDSLIYPILFNFRQYLEITIKATIRNYYIMSPNSYSDDIGFMPEHSLTKLWDVLKVNLLNTYQDSEESLATIEAVQALLHEFNMYDPGSYTFRYPFKRGKAHETLEYAIPEMTINLVNLKNTFEKCFYYFDSIYWHSADLLDLYQTSRD